MSGGNDVCQADMTCQAVNDVHIRDEGAPEQTETL